MIREWIVATLLGCALFCLSPAEAVKDKSKLQKLKWKVVSISSNRAKIAFPIKPVYESKVHVWGNTNMKLTYHSYYAKSPNDYETMLFIIDYPQTIQQAQKEGVYRSVLQGFINHHPKNRLVVCKPIQRQQSQGIEFVVQNGKQFYLGRAFIKNNQMFFLIFQCRSLQTNQQTYHNFVESLNWK